MSQDVANMEIFEARLARIHKTDRVSRRATIHKHAGIYDQNEADRQDARRFRISWRMVLKTAVIVWICFLGLRGFLEHEMGSEAYTARIVELRQGTPTQVIASYAMERGPIMNVVDTFLDRAQKKKLEAIVDATRNGLWFGETEYSARDWQFNPIETPQ